jgi:hypothetical protein
MACQFFRRLLFLFLFYGLSIDIFTFLIDPIMTRLA